MPFESTVTASNPAQLVFHGPDNDEAHSTDATVLVAKFAQTNTPFWLNELITGCCAKAATFNTHAAKPSFVLWIVAAFKIILG